MPKNDFTASAGISLEQWKKDIATMASDSQRIADGADKVGEALDAAASKARTFSSAFKVASVVGFGSAVVSEMAGINVAVGDTSKAFNKLQMTAFGDEAPKGMDALKNALMDSSEASKAFIKDATKGIPLLGAVADASMAAADITRKYATDALEVSIATQKEAESADTLVKKLKELRDARTTEHAKVPGLRNENSISQLNTEIATTEAKFSRIAGKEKGALSDTSAGQAQRIALVQLEIEKRQKLASLSESLKNQLGEKGDAGGKMFLAGAQKIDAEIALKKKAIELSQEQETSTAKINTGALKVNEQLDTQDAHLNLQATEAKRIAEFAQKRYGSEALVTTQLKEQQHQLEEQQKLISFNRTMVELQAREKVEQMHAEMSGNVAVADLEKIRIQYQGQILQAQREGNGALVQALQQQQALANLGALAKNQRMTPQQRRDERKEQEAQDLAIRHINAMEKNNPNSVPADGRFHVSPAAEKARREYAARHQMQLRPGDNAAKEVMFMRVNQLAVTQIKGA